MEKVLVPKKELKLFRFQNKMEKVLVPKKELKLFSFRNKMEKVLVPKKRTKTFQVSKQDGKSFSSQFFIYFLLLFLILL